MSSFEEKRFYIDPGKGAKRHNCPSYSCYEDGRDVKNEIISPRGYDLIGFRFDPHCSDKFYDGKIIAEYEKQPFITRFKHNFWKYLLVLLGLICVFVVLSELGVFNKDKPTPKTTQYISNRIDTVAESDSTSNISSNSTQPDSIPAKTDTLSSEAIISAENDISTSNTTEAPKVTVKEEPVVAKEETAEKKEEIVEKEESIKKEDKLVESAETLQFKKEFWALIHRKAKQMDNYDKLYLDHKGKVKGKEYDYLRTTILKNSTSFKDWVSKLTKIPDTEIQTIEDINTLTQKLKEIK